MAFSHCINLRKDKPLKKFEFLTDECVSDHNERIRSIQINKNFITQTIRMYNFIISRTVRNYLIVTIICGYYILRIFAIGKKSQN